jgi:predicted RNA-binding Zn-ribbon protein involved in translation (DUF1610 family)
MGLPQLVGKTCASCQKTISSIVEGEFCPKCGNPVHLHCQPADENAATSGKCNVCGTDPKNPVAVEVSSARKELATSGPRIVCPNCGSTAGFGPFRQEARIIPFGFLATMFVLLSAASNVGELQCFRCQYVFKPTSFIRQLGCLAILLMVAGIVAIFVLMRSIGNSP